jgi:hypothetical protein
MTLAAKFQVIATSEEIAKQLHNPHSPKTYSIPAGMGLQKDNMQLVAPFR